jgi:class 3 adenylate cyclase/tetratricopeptide (TPR) repeat protein
MTDQNQEASSRKVTVLYLSFSGFSNLQQGSGSREIASMLGRCISFTDQIIRLYSGKPDKYMGESGIAFYGMNEEEQKSCVNAIKSAIEMQHKFSDIKSEENLPDSLGLKIGIFTGEVLIATVGAGASHQENYFGEAIQLASHICSMATPGQILLGEETRKQARNDFTFIALEPVPVKGYKKPIAIYEVTVRKSAPTEPPLQSGRIITSAMVGRQKEVRTLEDSIKQLLNGRGGVVTIEGMAGIGKSRLMAEVMEKEITKLVAFFEGRALSEGKNLSFHPIIQIIKSWSGIKEDDNPAVSYQKLSANIIRIYPEQASEIIPFVATMMGFPLEGEAKMRVKGIEGEALERLILKNVRDLLARAVSIRPIVIMVEDAHWSDLSSISFMESLFKLVKNHRLLFINVFRPGFKETGERLKSFVKDNLLEHYREITVQPLKEDESAELIGNLLNQTNLPDDIKRLILLRSEGNPFFIEEVLRSFIDEGLIEIKDETFIVTDRIQYANIPETIDKVILSRIDRLDEKTKGLLRTASVIGRNFYYKVLEEAAQTIEELDTRLQYLKETQLLSEHRHKEEVEFLFKHALAQQATYDSILQKTKKELHLKIAKSIEKVFADKLPEFYGVLAIHYDKAELHEKTEEYLIKAGDESFRSGASNEALNYYLEAIKKIPSINDSGSLSSLYRELEIKIAFAHHATGRNFEAYESFNRILQRNYKRTFPVTGIGNLTSFTYNLLSLLFKLYFNSFYFSKPTDEQFDLYARVLTHWGEASTTFNPKRSFFQSFYFLKVLSNYDLTGSASGLKLFIGGSNFFNHTGLSLKTGRKMLDLAKKAGAKDHPAPLIYYRFLNKLLDYNSGILEEDKTMEHTFKVGMQIGDFWTTTVYAVYCGYAFIDRGDHNGFIKMTEKLNEIADSFDNSHARAQWYRLSAIGNFLFRKMDDDLDLISEGIAYAGKSGHFTVLLILWCIKSLSHSLKGETEEAEKAFQEAGKHIHDKQFLPIYYSQYLLARAWMEWSALKYCTDHHKPIKKEAASVLKTTNMIIRISKTVPSKSVEAWRLKAMVYRKLGKKNSTLKCFSKSIQLGQKYNCPLELSRTYFEAGKFLQDSDSKRNTILGFSANEYLLKAKSLFEEMDLQWDLIAYEKYMEN